MNSSRVETVVRQRPHLAPLIRTAAALAAALCALGCGGRETASGGGGTGPASRLAIVVSGDTAGWIVPCGCASRQSGGLLRRAAFLNEVRRDADAIVLDAGGAAAGTSAYQTLKFEAILAGERQMGVAVHNLGGPEAALGPDYLRALAERSGVPFVSANLRDRAGKLVAEPFRIVEVAGRRVAVIGVLSPRHADRRVKIDPPREAVLAALRALPEKVDWTVVLAYLPEPELRRLAAELPEADAIVGGPTGQSIAPQRVGPVLLASATNKGKFLVQLECSPNAEPASGRGWTGRVVELTPEFADDPPQVANLQAFRDLLARRELPAAETGFAPLVPADAPADYRVAGTDACMKCHVEDCRLWSESKHARAWQTLVAGGAHVDAYCQQCHTTGYGLPEGFGSVRASAGRVNVGCESCHGPSAAHARAADPRTRRTPFAAADQCVLCHDRENSPEFAYAEYWERIIHGAGPAASAQAGRTEEGER
ncbi:MAG: multiheme c-type cytochrome [Planctomycetales bacterium]